MPRKMTEEHRKLVAKCIEDALAERNWTKSKLAEKAGYDDRTVRNILSGYSAKYETYATICTAVGIDISKVIDSAFQGAGGQGIAPDLMGGYARKNVRALSRRVHHDPSQI